MLASPVHSVKWDENDVLSLRVALAVIDSWDCDLGALLEIDCDSSSSDTNKPKTSRAKHSKTNYTQRRDARKRQIAALEAEERDLKYVLSLGRALVGQSASSAMSSAWACLAHTQQSRRMAAERENATLRRTMRDQMSYAKDLLQLTKHVEHLEKALKIPALPSFVNYIGPNIDPVIHLREMETLISRATRVFSSAVFDRSKGLQLFTHTKFREDRPLEEGADLESQAVSILPFDVRDTAEAMWLHAVRPIKSRKTSTDVYENTNAVVSQFMGTSRFDDRIGVIQGQMAVRMLPPDLGDGSVLIVMRMVARTYVGSEIRGCFSSEGWIRMESGPTTALSRPLTIIKRYRRVLVTPPATSTMSLRERHDWTESVLEGPICPLFKSEFENVIPAIESMLLARTRTLSIEKAPRF